MKSKDKKTLIIITNGFPLSNSEIFLEKEIEFHQKYFSDVTIVACNPKINERKNKHININVKEWHFRYRLKKIRSLIFIFHPVFIHEIFKIRYQYKKRYHLP